LCSISSPAPFQRMSTVVITCVEKKKNLFVEGEKISVLTVFDFNALHMCCPPSSKILFQHRSSVASVYIDNAGINLRKVKRIVPYSILMQHSDVGLLQL